MAINFTHMISIIRMETPAHGGLGLLLAHWASGHGVSGAFGNGRKPLAIKCWCCSLASS